MILIQCYQCMFATIKYCRKYWKKSESVAYVSLKGLALIAAVCSTADVRKPVYQCLCISSSFRIWNSLEFVQHILVLPLSSLWLANIYVLLVLHCRNSCSKHFIKFYFIGIVWLQKELWWLLLLFQWINVFCTIFIRVYDSCMHYVLLL
jgi:hypothetical protein